jgi:RNA polymerase primary sigma factor
MNNPCLENAIANELKQKVLIAINNLCFREKEIIKMRYGFCEGGHCYTLWEIGKMFHITPERVRQIEAKAIRKLQHPQNSELLREAEG